MYKYKVLCTRTSYHTVTPSHRSKSCRQDTALRLRQVFSELAHIYVAHLYQSWQCVSTARHVPAAIGDNSYRLSDFGGLHNLNS